MLSALCVIIAILCVTNYVFNYNTTAKMMRKIPGFKFNFIIGNALEVFVSPEELFNKARVWASKFPGIYSFYIFPKGCVNIYNPEDVKTVLSTMKHHHKSIVYKLLKPWLQNGLLLSSGLYFFNFSEILPNKVLSTFNSWRRVGAKWQERRKILTPTFHFNVLRKYYSTMVESSLRLVDYLDNMNEKAIDVPSVFSEFTLASVCETAMGTKLNENTGGNGYKTAINDIKNVIYHRFINFPLYIDFIFHLTPLGKQQSKSLSIIHEFTQSVIRDRKRQTEHDLDDIMKDHDSSNVYGKKRTAFLDLLITAQRNGLTDDVGIQEEVDTFMFRGHDTLAAGFTFCLLLLAENTSVQSRVVNELQNIFGDDTRPATLEDLSMMQYLECCIKEGLRLYPPVPFISRKLSETVTLSNYTVPKGTMCHIHIYDLHRQENSFKNASQYNPDRFLPENSIGRHPYAYIAFSAGPRNCIGQKFAMMEMKLVISSILRRFEIVPVTTSEQLNFKADLILKNSEPVKLKFIRRHSCNHDKTINK